MTHTIHTHADPSEVVVLELPWTAPPLTLNQRLGRYPKRKLTREVRATARDLALAARVGPMIRPTVNLVWLVTTAHTRDEDNPVATLKALADGLVDANVAHDDSPRYMRKAMPVIHLAKGYAPAPAMYLVLWESEGRTPDEVRAIDATGADL